MRYSTLKTKAWSHRGVLAVSLIAAIAATAIAAVPNANEQPYAARVTAVKAGDAVELNITIVESGTGRLIQSRGMRARPNEEVTFLSGEKTSAGELELRVVARTAPDGTGSARLEVRRDGRMVQNSVHPVAEFTGEPITLNLRNADLSDILETFAEITGMKLETAPGVEEKVSIVVEDMPWDQALMEVARLSGTKITIDGNTIRVTK